MGIFSRKDDRLDEASKWFKNKIKPSKDKSITGEGVEDINLGSGSLVDTLQSFNLFNDSFINRQHKSEVNKIETYRYIAAAPEISDVVEDAVIESTQSDLDGNVLNLKILDEDVENNENKSKTLREEFKDLFYNKLKINEDIWDFFYSYYVDSRVYLERVGKNKKGVVKLKKLPAETMDYKIDNNGNIEFFVQYLKRNAQMPNTIEEAEKDPHVIAFWPQQISFIETGIYGKNRKDIIGYLEKCRQPYNQLKLLETAVIIYRIIRAPERLVFRIDTGNMPKDKAMKYVEKLKKKFQQNETYDPDTGAVGNKTAVQSLLSNYFIPQSADGRGSQIDSIGGNFSAFSELDDLHYFQKKLYRSLKYPMSRVVSMHEGNHNDIMFGGGRMGEITRDEIKWAKFLERQQFRFAHDFRELFLLHLEFKGIKKEYELDRSSFSVEFNPPNWYTDEMNQMLLEQRIDNYQKLSREDEFPKSYLMKRFLEYDDEDLEEIKKGFEKDKEIFPQDEGGRW